MMAVILNALLVLAVLFLVVAGSFVNAAWHESKKHIEAMHYVVAALFSIAATVALLGMAYVCK